MLPKQFMESYIKLIPKNKEFMKSKNDFRPISLTNIDYRILSKALVKRASKVTDKLINKDQKCIGDGRSMSSIIHLLRDLVEDANRRKNQLIITSIDQQKAFDTIDHQYIFKLISHLRLGDFNRLRFLTG